MFSPSSPAYLIMILFSKSVCLWLSSSTLTEILLPTLPLIVKADFCSMVREGNLDCLLVAVDFKPSIHWLRPAKLMRREPATCHLGPPSPMMLEISLGNLKGISYCRRLPAPLASWVLARD